MQSEIKMSELSDIIEDFALEIDSCVSNRNWEHLSFLLKKRQSIIEKEFSKVDQVNFEQLKCLSDFILLNDQQQLQRIENLKDATGNLISKQAEASRAILAYKFFNKT